MRIEITRENVGRVARRLSVGLFVAALLAGVLLVGLGIREVVNYRDTPVTILPWTPGTEEKPSPYVCFAAMKGGGTLVALDCLDTSLTKVLVE